MALEITNAVFKQNDVGISGLTSVYIDLVPVFGVNKLTHVTVRPRIFKDNTQLFGLSKIDHIVSERLEIPGGTEYWHGIDNGLIHDLYIAKLEEREPSWVGKIAKVIPIV